MDTSAIMYQATAACPCPLSRITTIASTMTKTPRILITNFRQCRQGVREILVRTHSNIECSGRTDDCVVAVF